MKLQITEKNMAAMIAINVNSEKNPLLRIVPLFIKNFVMKLVFNAVGERKTCFSFSNLGVVNVPEEFSAYVDRLDFVLGNQASAPYNTSAITYPITPKAQLFNVLKEAEAYPGPSLVIAYAPCINHGIKGGLTIAQQVEKEAVEAGYWHLFRFNPALAAEGKSPFSLDSKAPTGDYKAFMMREVRYNSLMRANPERATALFDIAEQNAKDKYKHLVEMDKMYKAEFEG